MRPFYFGRSEAPLFGMHHAPASGAPRRGAAVLCHPFGAEYMRAHRSIRELASRLAQAGFHVLRFDYFGTGDSAGEGEDADLDRWLDDIGTAIDEVRDLSESSAVSLIGLRLGATLSALLGSRRGDVKRAVLWAPIVDGRGYLEELAVQHRAWFDLRPKPDDAPVEAPAELLGAPVSAKLRRDIESLDLTRLERSPAQSVLLVGNAQGPGQGELEVRLRELCGAAESLHVPGSSVWVKSDFDQQLVPPQTLQAIAGWLSRPAA
jgi:alpha-beta hydrolase superfamily lysophospholipase